MLIATAGILSVHAFTRSRQIPPITSLWFLEDGRLHRLVAGSTSVTSTQITDNVGFILDVRHDLGKILFSSKPEGGATSLFGSLWIATQDGSVAEIYPVTDDSAISPDGTKIALVAKDEERVKILDLKGNVLQTIPGFGGGTVTWNHAGDQLAYIKVVDPPCSSGEDLVFNSDRCRSGISIFNLKTETSELILKDGDADGPVAFTQDDQGLYFNSSKAYDEWPEAHIVSIWLLDLQNKQTRRLTNHFEGLGKGLIPTLNDANTIWTSDGKMAISSRALEEGTWLFTFLPSGGLANVERLSDGDSPSWLVQDATIAVRVIHNGTSSWQVVNIH